MAGDERTVGEILGVADPAGGVFEILPEREPTLQEKVAARLIPVLARGPHPARIMFDVSNTLEEVSAWVSRYAARIVGPMPTWVRFYRSDQSNGLLAVVSGPVLPNEADLVLCADRPGMLTRSTLRAIAGWAFGSCGLPRIVVRIPADADRLKDYARRAGFRHEGTARDFYGEGADASVWAMLARECRWLGPRPAPAVPPLDTPPSASDRRH